MNEMSYQDLRDRLLYIYLEGGDILSSDEQREFVDAAREAIGDLVKENTELSEKEKRLRAYEKHYGVMTGAAVELILTGTLPFKSISEKENDN